MLNTEKRPFGEKQEELEFIVSITPEEHWLKCEHPNPQRCLYQPGFSYAKKGKVYETYEGGYVVSDRGRFLICPICGAFKSPWIHEWEQFDDAAKTTADRIRERISELQIESRKTLAGLSEEYDDNYGEEKAILDTYDIVMGIIDEEIINDLEKVMTEEEKLL